MGSSQQSHKLDARKQKSLVLGLTSLNAYFFPVKPKLQIANSVCNYSRGSSVLMCEAYVDSI